MSYRPIHSLAVASLAASLFALPAPAVAGGSPAKACGAAAAGLAGQIATNFSESTYSHVATADGEPDVALVDGQWQSFTDCSGFVSYVVQETAPRQYEAVAAEKEPNHPWPRAHVYRRFFAQLPKLRVTSGWIGVPDLRKARPGDILAWCIGDYCTATGDVHEPGDTGHVMVIGAVTQLDPETVIATVYDSSSVVHYGNPPYTCAPSGAPCDTTGRDGVGIGAIHFKIDATGAPVAFQMNANGRWHPEPNETIQFAIGRLVGVCR